jgi:flagellar biosynthesis anti-sigma factor FlgM
MEVKALQRKESMKIPGSDGNGNKLNQVADGINTDRSNNGRAVRAGQNRTETGAPAAPGRLKDDSVQVSSLGSLMQSELDPTRMAAERKEKLERLKQQVQNGTYKPPLEEVAAAMSQELAFEIMLAGDEEPKDESLI